jgi:hypothetical protein
MIKISIPNNNINERQYVIEVVFHEFLGIEYELNISSNDYEILLENGKKLLINDLFFNKYPKSMSYLKKENIPNEIEELDIFAAIFFMLTRWEEYVKRNRDSHNRFPASESLIYKQGLLEKPIVDVYIDKLKSTLISLDSELYLQKKSANIYLTHDIDKIYKWKGWKKLLKQVVGDLVKRRSLHLACERLVEYYSIQINKKKDPFDTFDFLMNQSEIIDEKSRFYFMSGGVTSYDNKYEIDEPKALELINKIKLRGHFIGFHPSYNSYNNKIQFKKELEFLEKIVGHKITEGRQHYLRFEVPTTWQIWEDSGMKIDSTCAYADKEGFRCGTGNEFSVFNILTRKKLNLKERPLVYMDCTIFDYQNLTDSELNSLINNISNNSTKTILWHNSYINKLDFYSEIISRYKKGMHEKR